MKYFLKSGRAFVRLVGPRTYRLFTLMIVATAFEGLSIFMFLPVLELAGGGEPGTSLLSRVAQSVFAGVRIPMSLPFVLMLMVLFFIVRSLVLVYQTSYLGRVQGDLLVDLRYRNLVRLFRSDFLYYTSKQVGYFSNAVTREFEGVTFAFNMYVTVVVKGLFVLLYVAFCLVVQPWVTVCTLIAGALLFPFMRFINRRVREFSMSSTRHAGFLQSLVIQTLNHFKYFKATSAHPAILDRIQEQSRKLGELVHRQAFFAGISQYGFQPIIVVLVALILLYQVVIAKQNIGASIFILALLHKTMSELIGLQQNYRKFAEYAGSLAVFEELQHDLARVADDSDSSKVMPSVAFDQPLILDRVSFSYDQQHWVLKNVTLSIPARSTVAFVGASGAGKSTLVNLLTGILQPSEGDLRLGSLSYRSMDKEDLRRQIGYITQESVIVNDTILNNVTLWDAHPNMERFWSSLERAHIKDFVTGVSEREKTMLGDNGIKISGGQRQRIAIARELYKSTKLLLFDEATSSLDSQTEKLIQHDIDELHGDKTVVLIAHRLSTVRNSDMIFVLKDGVVAEQGTYDELSRSSNTFRDMLNAQTT